jgi:predicted amidohydrolase YtcJ
MWSCEKKHQDTRREKIDLLVVNATIYTVDSSFTVAEAMAIKNGLIVATGERKELEQRYDAQNIYDAGGHFIFPGFYDAHCHFIGYAQTLAQADLVGAASPQEVIERLKAFRKQNPDLPWLLGRGWDQNDWIDKSFPDRRLLDEAFPDIPVFLTRIDGHAAWVNTKALQEAALLRARKVEGGSIQLRPDGSPSGILIDNAVDLVERHIPPMSREMLSKLLLKAQQNCFAVGLTTLSDAGLPLEHIRLLDSLQQSGSLRMRL